jgi:hypothetical protein
MYAALVAMSGIAPKAVSDEIIFPVVFGKFLDSDWLVLLI